MYCVDLPIQINKQNKMCTEKCIMGNEKLRGGKKMAASSRPRCFLTLCKQFQNVLRISSLATKPQFNPNVTQIWTNLYR